MARRSTAWLVPARLSIVRLSSARQGKDDIMQAPGLSPAWQSTAEHGAARLGRVQQGVAQQSKGNMKPWCKRRPDTATWRKMRKKVWLRDGKKCVQCIAEGRPDPEISLRQCHIDHIVPLSKGGSNKLENLRTLCRYHHVLRQDASHRGMIAKALQDGVIPPDWRKLVW